MSMRAEDWDEFCDICGSNRCNGQLDVTYCRRWPDLSVEDLDQLGYDEYGNTIEEIEDEAHTPENEDETD